MILPGRCVDSDIDSDDIATRRRSELYECLVQPPASDADDATRELHEMGFKCFPRPANHVELALRGTMSSEGAWYLCEN